jgi:hypothetical protein
MGLPSLFNERFQGTLVNLGFPHVHTGFRIGQLMSLAQKSRKAAGIPGLSVQTLSKKN